MLAQRIIMGVVFLCVTTLPMAQAQKTDLFVFIGQSNMAGRAFIEGDTARLKNVFLLNSEGEFVPARNPLNIHSTIRKDRRDLQRLSPAYSFCQYYLEATDKDAMRIIVQARGGTSIEKFLKGSNWGYYEATLNRIANSLKQYPDSELKAILFHQGESNRNNPQEYLAMLKSLAQSIRTDLNQPSLPIICGELGQWNNRYEAIRAEMQKIPALLDGLHLVSSKGLTNQDEHHFDRVSALELGKRYAKKYLEATGFK